MDEIASVVLDNGSGMCKAGCMFVSYYTPELMYTLTLVSQSPATMPPVLSSRMHSKRSHSPFSLTSFLQGHRWSSPPASVHARNAPQGRLRRVRSI